MSWDYIERLIRGKRERPTKIKNSTITVTFSSPLLVRHLMSAKCLKTSTSNIFLGQPTSHWGVVRQCTMALKFKRLVWETIIEIRTIFLKDKLLIFPSPLLQLHPEQSLLLTTGNLCVHCGITRGVTKKTLQTKKPIFPISCPTKHRNTSIFSQNVSSSFEKKKKKDLFFSMGCLVS